MSKLKVLPKRIDILDVNDNSCQFRINIDVLNEAFGVGRAMYAKASYPDKKGGYFPETSPETTILFGCLNYIAIVLSGRTPFITMERKYMRMPS